MEKLIEVLKAFVKNGSHTRRIYAEMLGDRGAYHAGYADALEDVLQFVENLEEREDAKTNTENIL